MNKIVNELKKVKVFFIATVDGQSARVRPFASVTEYEGGAYICCGNFKEVYRQIVATPRVELCGTYEDGCSWLRVATTLVEDDRIEVQRAILDDPTGPKGLYEAGDGRLATFRLIEIDAKRFSFIAPPEKIEE